MTAKIGLEDVRFHAPHGFYEEEHLMGNEFSIDVEVEAAITSAAQNDDLGGTVNYATIYYLLQAEMKKPTQLLEALAYRMGNRILNQFDSVRSVKLRLRKLNPPLGGKVGAAVVEVNLGEAAVSSFGGRAATGGHTFEEAAKFAPGGGFGGGGMKEQFGGGMRGMSGLPKKKAPPPPDDEDFADMDELTPEELEAMEADDELEYLDDDDDAYGEVDLEILKKLGLGDVSQFGLDDLPPPKS